MPELELARQQRDEAFTTFVLESEKATKHTVKAGAARHKYMLAANEVRAIERDLLAFPISQ